MNNIYLFLFSLFLEIVAYTIMRFFLLIDDENELYIYWIFLPVIYVIILRFLFKYSKCSKNIALPFILSQLIFMTFINVYLPKIFVHGGLFFLPFIINYFLINFAYNYRLKRLEQNTRTPTE